MHAKDRAVLTWCGRTITYSLKSCGGSNLSRIYIMHLKALFTIFCELQIFKEEKLTKIVTTMSRGTT